MLDKASIRELTMQNLQRFEEEGLKGSKLSIRKYETMLHIKSYFAQNHFDWFDLPESEIIQHLKNIKGIGHWMIDMILLYTFGFPDVFPIDDYHVKIMMNTIYAEHAAGLTKKQRRSISDRWSPYRSLAFYALIDYKNTNPRP